MKLRIVLIKPSKYLADGAVERFEKGFMPNATLTHIAGLTPARCQSLDTEVVQIDEYVHDSLDYLQQLAPVADAVNLVAVVGVQSHQFHRAIDLAALARCRGIEHVVIGGPHPMTCDTGELQGKGVSFCLAEAELVWHRILADAVDGALKPVYGRDERWSETLDDVIVDPPPPASLARYWSPMVGLYPVRGCPFECRFCSVIKISGRRVRSPSIESTLESLRRASAAGVEVVMFVSDNFNKFPQVRGLLQAMIEERINIGFFCQCDTQIARDPALVQLLGAAGCQEMFVGVESFNRAVLRDMRKAHNRPDSYRAIVEYCREAGIASHFSNIIGFPDDTAKDIETHLQVLQEIDPDLASFYLLTPIPGTEQYDDYRAAGLIDETNLDRFDGTCPTWRHPHLSAEALQDWLFEAYRRFYTHAMRTRRAMPPRLFNAVAFNRWCANRRVHPMSGGINPLVLDRLADYLDAREQVFGSREPLALPDSLPLGPAEIRLNRGANWRPAKPEPVEGLPA